MRTAHLYSFGYNLTVKPVQMRRGSPYIHASMITNPQVSYIGEGCGGQNQKCFCEATFDADTNRGFLYMSGRGTDLADTSLNFRCNFDVVFFDLTDQDRPNPAKGCSSCSIWVHMHPGVTDANSLVADCPCLEPIDTDIPWGWYVEMADTVGRNETWPAQ